MINGNNVGAFPMIDATGAFTVRLGLYLQGIRSTDGFIVRVRIIHRDDRFKPDVPTRNFDLQWQLGSMLDLWSVTAPIAGGPGKFGSAGTYLYRFQLLWVAPGQAEPTVLTEWFTDPFARATDIGRLSAFTLDLNAATFAWTDAAYKTPALDDLIVYELQVEEFNDTFSGIIDRLDYLQSLGVNCLELMPVMSSKLDFDWGYGPLHFFAPSARFGGPEGLRQLVDAAHSRNIAVILDVVYEHVDQMFAYFRVYDDVMKAAGTPKPSSPMIKGWNKWGFGPATDFAADFTREYFLLANKMWLDEYHVDGFRYDEVTDWYDDQQRAAGYRQLTEDTYLYSLGVTRFQGERSGYSRIVQCAEALGRARQILAETYSNCAWQDDLLNKAEDMIHWNYTGPDFAHLLDPSFCGYPGTKTVVNAAGRPVEMPVAPFQYIETHDHSQLIVCAATESDPGPLPEGDRSRFYLMQPYAIALYTAQGIPMLWQGQEFADNYDLPVNGLARVHLRRDTHWEYFYDAPGTALIRLYRCLGRLRHTYRCLRSRESYFYYQQSLQGNQVLAYHRHAPAAEGQPEEFALVLLNFGNEAASISVPFPQAGNWREMIDGTMSVRTDGSLENINVPSHYGMIFILET